MTRILVTGGAGFIGSHYVRSLLGPTGPGDVSVTVLDKLTYAGNLSNLTHVARHPLFTFVQGDICDAPLVNDLLSQHDQVVHFAAESHVDNSIMSGTSFVLTNAVGTQVLLDAAVRHRIQTFVQVSTDEVYGSIDTGSWSESQPLDPNSPYSASKASGDQLAIACWRTHGLNIRLTRCSNNYGTFQYPEKIIPLFITNLIDRCPVPLYGDGANVRDWLHVQDHIQGIELVRVRGRAGEIYNLGGGTELTNRRLTELLLQACDSGWDMVEAVTDRKGHDRRYSVDWSKARTELGYQPQIDFRVGLEATVDWYQAHRDWWQPLKLGRLGRS